MKILVTFCCMAPKRDKQMALEGNSECISVQFRVHQNIISIKGHVMAQNPFSISQTTCQYFALHTRRASTLTTARRGCVRSA